MDNAVDALHLAFVALILVIALSVAIYMITLARQTSAIVFQTTDKTAYLPYEERKVDNVGIASQNRIVSFETIIPTLFKYNSENYAVVFLDASKDGYYDPVNGIINQTEPLYIYESLTNKENWKPTAAFLHYEIHNNHVTKTILTNDTFDDGNDELGVNVFDLTEENYRNEPWIGSNELIKNNLKAIFFGSRFKKSATDTIEYNYEDNPIDYINTNPRARFIELVGHYKTIEESDEVIGNNTVSKTVIIYVYIGNS